MTSAGEIDGAGLHGLVDFAAEVGTAGVLCTALAGEISQLTRAERRQVIDVVINAAGDRLPVIVGVGNDPDSSLELARFAARHGASAVMVSAPANYSPSESSDWMIRTALGLEIRVVVQEAPGFLGNAVGPEGLSAIVRTCENVRDIKVEGGAQSLAAAKRHLAETTFWGGDGGAHALSCMRAGAAGFMPGVEVVDVLVAVCLDEREQRCRDAEKRFASVLPLLAFEMQSLETYVPSAKQVLVQRGFLRSDRCRLAPRGLPTKLMQVLAEHLRVALTSYSSSSAS